MTGLTVLITGGASGIGFGIASHFGQLGHRVILADINMEAATEAAKSLQQQSIDASAVYLNMADKTQIAKITQSLPYPVDVLVNNAGIQHVAPLDDFPADKWQLLIDVMLVGPALLTQALLPSMKQRNFGRIINLGSIHSLIASPFKSAYVAAKHGLIGFAKTLALEVGEQNITINTLCPSYVKTPLVEQQIAAQAKSNNLSEHDVINKIMLEPMPKKAFIEIEELAHAAAFLLGPGAKNMTAQTIVLDGGWIAK